MKPLEQFMDDDWTVCHWRGTEETFRHVAATGEKSQTGNVIKPIHWV